MMHTKLVGRMRSVAQIAWLHRLTLLLALALCTPAQAALRIEPPAVELGVMRTGSTQSVTVKITNDGPVPLKLLGAQSDCQACTKIGLEPVELAPGKSTSMSIAFSPTNKELGAVDRKVLVSTSDPNQPHVVIRMSGYVAEVAALIPWRLTFDGPQQAGQQIKRELELVNLSDKPLKMLYATTPVEGPRVAVSPEPVPPGGKGTLNIVWDLPGKTDSYAGNAVIFVDHPVLTKITLPYSVRVVGAAVGGAATRAARVVGERAADAAPATTTAATQALPATGSAAAAPSEPPAKLVNLALKDSLTLRDLVEIIATELKLNLVFDEQALNLPVTVRLSGPIREDALLPLLRSVLQAKGFTLVATERPEIWRVVQAKEAPQAVHILEQEAGPAQFVTDVITPTHVDVETLAGILKGFITTGQLTPVPEAKLLIVSDYKTQVEHLRNLVAILDKGSPKAEVGMEVVPVKAAEAAPLVDRITKLLSQLNLAEGTKADANRLFISADNEHNQIVLIGRMSEFSRVRQLIDSLDHAPALVRASYVLPDEQRETAVAVIEQILGRDARSKALDGSMRLAITAGTASVAATEGQHQKIRDALNQYIEPAQAQEVKLKAYRIKNRDASEIQAILTRLLGVGGEGDGGYATAPPTPAYGLNGQQGITRVGSAVPPSPSVQVHVPALVPPTTQAVGSSAPSGSSDVRITVDLGTNTLLIAAPANLHRRAAELIEQLDERQAQVLLEVMLVSVTDSDTFSYAVEAAIEFSQWGATSAVGSNFGIGSGPLSDRTLNTGRGFNAAVLNPGAFSAFLRALQETNKAKVISLPQVLAVDNKPAAIRSVQQEPFISINASQTVSTTSFGGFAEAGTTLEVTPHIAPADYLNLEYRLEVSSFTGASPAASVPPPRRSDTVSSFISVPDGNTVIVGGLSSSNRSKGVSKIPGLGDIPILGYLARSQSKTANQSTFYIFVRPTILRGSRFEDLKFLTQQPRIMAGIPGDYPRMEPLNMHE